MTNDCFDVAIVGFGPAGAGLANLLGQAGLSVVVYERDAQVYALPRAIHFDGEVMRIFQAMGLRSEVENISRAGLKGMHFVNEQNQTLLIRGGTGLNGPHGCANNYYFHQPQLETVLRKGLERFANVHIALEHEVQELTPLSDHVQLRVHDLRNNKSSTQCAKYVIGCDGARSAIRKSITSNALDLGLDQPWLVFDILLHQDMPELPDHTVQICDPARPMTFCNVTKERRRFEIMLMPQDDHKSIVQEKNLWPLVSSWVKPSQASIERAAIYTFHSVVVRDWRKARILIAGDAAHQTPPFLGQGMCACLRDVSNLAWKLIKVCRDGVHDSLLNTYESERSPHVHAFIELAVKIGDIIQTTDPALAQARDEQLLSGKPSIFEFPAPKLGSGFWLGEHPAVAGICPQPILQDGHLMDETTGNDFCLIVQDDQALAALNLDALHDSLSAQWHSRGWPLINAQHQSPDLTKWLKDKEVNFALIRPDRYVAAAHQNAQAFSHDVTQLFSHQPT